MLLHGDKQKLHCIYASDGAKSPTPLLPWLGAPAADLTALRAREAAQALAEVGVPQQNMTLLDLPDGRLAWSKRELQRLLERDINRIRPDFIFVPFRYDLHSDHVAVHRAVRELWRADRIGGVVLEYFIYFRWRLIDGGDIRRRIAQGKLMQVDIASVAAAKRRALSRYRSQTEVLYPWQDMPILTPESVQQRCSQPEWFLVSDPAEPLAACFPAQRQRTVSAHYIERLGKRRKDQLVAFVKWLTPKHQRPEA